MLALHSCQLISGLSLVSTDCDGLQKRQQSLAKLKICRTLQMEDCIDVLFKAKGLLQHPALQRS